MIHRANYRAPRARPAQPSRPIPGDRMSRFGEFQRRRTAANIAVERMHDRRPKDRISHADRHDTSALPFGAPEIPGGTLDGGAGAVGKFGHKIGKPPHPGLVARVGVRRVVGGGFRRGQIGHNAPSIC